MSKFYFKYGTMNSSKTANLLMTVHNYESLGRKVLCLKPIKDTRDSDKQGEFGNIDSRAIAISHPCKFIDSEMDLFKYISDLYFKFKFDAVLIDEAQFLTKSQVRDLADIVNEFDIDVLCFGLKNTYADGELFEGSQALLYYASSLEEIKTVCKFCKRKATMNLRTVDNKAVYEGNTLKIGDVKDGEDMYHQVCYYHYSHPPKPLIGPRNGYRGDVHD